MIYFLRNISVRLWFSVLLSIPATFTIFPAIENLVPNLNASVACIILLFFLFILTGYIINLAGEHSIAKYINDAKNWERDGLFNKSEICYLRAIEIFDSYLLTVLHSKKTALPLTGAIARFSLTAGWKNDHFENATTFFLHKNPHETEVAYLWLQNMIKQNNIKQFTYQEENLFTRLAEIEPISLKLVPLLAEIFTITKRADFAAKKVFTIMKKSADMKNFNIKKGGECFDISESSDNAEMLESSEGDEIFESSEGDEIFENTPDIQSNSNFSKITKKISKATTPKKFGKTQLSDELGNELSDEQSDELSNEQSDELTHNYQIHHHFSGTRAKRRKTKVIKKSFFSILSSILTNVIKPKFLWLLSIAIKVIVIIISLPMNTISLLLKVVHLFLRIFVRFVRKIHRNISIHPELRKNIKRLITFTVVMGVLTLFFNTVSHLFSTSAPPPPLTQKLDTQDSEEQTVPQKKFTIQVAAYLVKSHAEQYLKKLEEKGLLGGTVVAIEGGGKTWYLIRVGQYETKESATLYGNKLKSQGIVKDFFVDNSG